MTQVANDYGGNLTPIILFKEVIAKYGIEESLILDSFIFWCCKNEVSETHLHDGRYWTFNSLNAIASMFSLSQKQIRRVVRNLVNAKVLLVGNFNETKFLRTSWYAVDFDKLADDGFPNIRERTLYKIRKKMGIQQQPSSERQPVAESINAIQTERTARKILTEYPKSCVLANGNTPLYRRSFASVGGELMDVLESQGISDDCGLIINVLKFKEAEITSRLIPPVDFIKYYFEFKTEYESSLPKLRIATVNRALYENGGEYNFKSLYYDNAPNFEPFFGISREFAYHNFISKGIFNPPVEYYE